MTNREHYSEQIIDICAKGERPIIDADGLYGNTQNYTNRRQSK